MNNEEIVTHEALKTDEAEEDVPVDQSAEAAPEVAPEASSNRWSTGTLLDFEAAVDIALGPMANVLSPTASKEEGPLLQPVLETVNAFLIKRRKIGGTSKKEVRLDLYVDKVSLTKITKDTKAGTTLKTEPLAEVPLAQGAVEYHNVGDDSCVLTILTSDRSAYQIQLADYDTTQFWLRQLRHTIRDCNQVYMLQLQDRNSESGMMGQAIKVGWLNVRRDEEELTHQFVIMTDHWIAGYSFIPKASEELNGSEWKLLLVETQLKEVPPKELIKDADKCAILIWDQSERVHLATDNQIDIDHWKNSIKVTTFNAISLLQDFTLLAKHGDDFVAFTIGIHGVQIAYLNRDGALITTDLVSLKYARTTPNSLLLDFHKLNPGDSITGKQEPVSLTLRRSQIKAANIVQNVIWYVQTLADEAENRTGSRQSEQSTSRAAKVMSVFM